MQTVSSAQEIFERIYRDKLWGGRKGFWKRSFWQKFYSGPGSSGRAIWPYLHEVRPLIMNREVVDLGCGDFTVGCLLCPVAKSYIACDIARQLIEHNKRKFAHLGINFMVLDAVNDQLPYGEVVLVRQVLQHLDNASIARIAAKLLQYQIAIVTEHIPKNDFVPNADMPIGRGTRLAIGSGIVLTEPPFNLAARKIHVLCEVPQLGGIVRTIKYTF